MKRTQLKRKAGVKRKPSPGTKRVRRGLPAWKLEDLPRQLFREAARQQRVWHSPVCKSRTKAHAHHVVYEQHAARLGGNPHDPRNVMRVCGHCHFQHHHRVDGAVIPVSALPASALAYARELLGPALEGYLRRYYDLDVELA